MRLCLSPEHMRDLVLLLLVILGEKVPAVGRLHVVDECSLFVDDLVFLLLLFGAVNHRGPARLEVAVDNLFDLVQLFAFETLQKDVIFDVLKHMRIDLPQLFRGSDPLLFL